MKTLANIVAAFGANIGLDGLCFDEKGGCALEFDDVVVNLDYDEPGNILYAYSRVCGLPEGDAEKLALYGMLLELNSFFKGTDGGILGIEPLLGAVTYTNRIGIAHLDETILDARIGRHVTAVEALRSSIEGLRDRSGTAEEASWESGMLRI